jgi:lipopolysaccharide export system permease protein
MKWVLGNYLRRRVAGQVFALLLALAALMQLMELLDVTTEVLDRGLGVAGVLRYATLRLPAQLELSLPLAGLLGSMAAFLALARTREITALRTAGVGLTRVMLHLLPVPLVFALLHVALAQKLVPMAEGALASWWDDAVPLEERAADPEWVHTSGGVLLFQRHSADGARLLDLRIFERGADGHLNLRTRAEEANWQDGAWQLSGIAELAVQSNAGDAAPIGRRWESNLRPDDVVRLDAAEPHLSNVELAAVIGGERVGTRPRSFYETVLMQSFAAPFTVFIMMLLAIPAALVSDRGGGGGRILIALVLGLGFLLIDGVFSAFGTSGRIGPLVAAFAAPLAFAMVGLVQLRSAERA